MLESLIRIIIDKAKLCSLTISGTFTSVSLKIIFYKVKEYIFMHQVAIIKENSTIIKETDQVRIIKSMEIYLKVNSKMA
jgi:hypothetical protein